MANFTIPGTWELDGQTGNTQVVYVIDGHTVAENYQILFDRVVPQVGVSGARIAEYRIRIRRTHVDSEGAPITGVTLFDSKLRWNVEADVADVKAVVTLAAAVFSDAELPSDIVDSLRLPR